MNTYKVIVVTYCEDSYCPMNVPVRAAINKRGEVVAAHRLSDGSGTIISSNAQKSLKYIELVHDIVSKFGIIGDNL